MNSKPLAFKIAALSFSVMLAGSYVWYRAGGDVPFISTAAAETPDPVPHEPPAIADDVAIPPEILARTEASEEFEQPSKPGVVDREVLLGGSKSDRVFVETQPAPSEQVRARTVLPGSKSAAVVVERNREWTDEKPETAQREQKPTPPKRTILPGSKSAMVIEREPKPQAAPESGQQQRQQAAPKSVILPGSKSAEVDVSNVRPTPTPQPTPEETKRTEEEVRKRTILPGSKSMRIDVDRIRERTPAPKREPEPKPETGPADKPGESEAIKFWIRQMEHGAREQPGR